MKTVEIKRVIVVSKTHLDVGFTDYAENVMRRYAEDFIPRAVDLAFRLNTPTEKKFVWTTGAYLIQYALKNADGYNRDRLRDAIRLGYVAYHALPLTTHTELMSRELFLYGLSVAKRLDGEFGFHTVAAKMTDVPGHTVAIVPLMADAGIRYLHLGVNASSRVPKTPPIFRWRNRNKEIAVSYNGDYAAPLALPNGTVLEMLHTHDNFGPPSVEEIEAFYAQLHKKYPKAQICAGTLDDFALEMETVWEQLPVVEEEIGDTWIHGIATDPVKTSALKRLLRLSDGWLDNGTMLRDTAEYDTYMENLMLVTEHTWGMDVKKYLLDFSNWRKKDFLRALRNDKTDYSFYGKANAAIFAGMKPELDKFRADNETSAYSLFTKSHREQREYLEKAINALSQAHQAEARAQLRYSYPDQTGAVAFVPFEPVACGNWQVTFTATGAISHIYNPVLGIDRDVVIGEYEYESFSGATVKKCYYAYGRDLDVNFHWAECDFGKPGLEYCAEIQDRRSHAKAQLMKTVDNRVTVFMRGDTEACEEYGCPRELALEYIFYADTVELTLYWRGKDPVRSPEALWLGFNLYPSNPARTCIQKLGDCISPLNVISGGNRKLHAIESVSCKNATDYYKINTTDAPLVSIGGKHLYDVDDDIENPGRGMYFLLCNNRWGTNFPQWFSDDARFTFEIKLTE